MVRNAALGVYGIEMSSISIQMSAGNVASLTYRKYIYIEGRVEIAIQSVDHANLI